MRFNSVLLVSPPSSSRYGGLRVPAGIGYIAQALHDQDIDYEYVDMRIGYGFEYLKKKASRFKPDLIGISMITLEYKNTYALIARIKNEFPGSKIVVGGHHVTIFKEKVLEECRDIDFGVVNEGEETILELCRDELSLENIKGLMYNDGSVVRFTGDRPCVGSLDQYAFPRYHRFSLNDYSKQIPIHSSRGCPYQCIFCPNKLIGRKFQTRSVHHFVDEIEYWHSKGYYQFAIDDDNFTLKKSRAHEICDEIERRGLKNLFIRCSNGIRADRVDRKLLGRMKDIGVREVGFGVDGGNNRVLGSLKKGETIETIEQAIRDACELGMDVKIFIIVGTPHETIADIEDSIRLAQKYPVARVNFNNAIPYPGTEMYDYVTAHHLFLVPPEVYLNEVAEEKGIPVFETPELSREERIKMLKRCHQVEREVTKNHALRMFNKNIFARFFIRNFFDVKLFEGLFFNNLLFRQVVEWIRYHKILMR